jgi:regulation of enolase protein 1 (concanavalin A-like superfamily)
MKTCLIIALFALCASSQAADPETLVLEDFNGKLDEDWSWVRERREAWRLRDRALEIRVEPGNMWGSQNDARNVLVRAAPGAAQDEIEVSVTFENNPTHQYEQVDLVWYYDDSNMVKIGQELVDGKLSVVMGREEKDKARTIAIVPLNTRSVRVRFRVQGDNLHGQFLPTDSKQWQEAGKCTLPVPAGQKAKISIQCYQGAENVEHWARITKFAVVKSPPR